jgi:hypothetical protein
MTKSKPHEKAGAEPGFSFDFGRLTVVSCIQKLHEVVHPISQLPSHSLIHRGPAQNGTKGQLVLSYFKDVTAKLVKSACFECHSKPGQTQAKGSTPMHFSRPSSACQPQRANS